MKKRLWNSVKSAIHGGLLYILSGNILVKAVSFIASIVVINVISKEDLAYLTYATNIYSYVSLISRSWNWKCVIKILFCRFAG